MPLWITWSVPRASTSLRAYKEVFPREMQEYSDLPLPVCKSFSCWDTEAFQCLPVPQINPESLRAPTKLSLWINKAEDQAFITVTSGSVPLGGISISLQPSKTISRGVCVIKSQSCTDDPTIPHKPHTTHNTPADPINHYHHATQALHPKYHHVPNCRYASSLIPTLT